MDATFSFQIRDDDNGVADDLRAILAEELPDWSCRQATTTETSDLESKHADGATIAMLVLATPPAILATWDLSRRLQLKQRLDRALARMKDLCHSRDVTVLVVDPDGRTVEIHQATTTELLDAISKQDDRS